MFLLGRVASQEQKARFLQPLINGSKRSAFFMTEPAGEGGAGSDPSMLKTTARRDGDYWIVNGRKAFITGARGAGVGIVMARSEEGATLFLVDLPDPAIHIERVLDTIVDINRMGVTIFMVEQNAELALSIASRGYVLQSGRLVLEGPARDLLSNPAVREAYLGQRNISGDDRSR